LVGAIDTLRRKFPDLLLIDSGDFLTTYPQEKTNRLVWEFVHDMKYDAIGVGDQEFVEGNDFLLMMNRQFPLPLTSVNILSAKTNEPVFFPYRLFERSGLRIGILSVVPKTAFFFIKEPEIRVAGVEERLRETLKFLKSRSEIIILLCHTSQRDMLALAQQFPDVSVFIAGHSQEKVERLLENQIVVQPGVDGEYLGLLKIRKHDTNFHFENKFIPVGPSFGQNKHFKEKVDQFYRELKEGKPN